MSIFIRWFPPSWFQIRYKDKIVYIDPAWMRTLFTNYPRKVEFSKWPDPIDGLPEKDLEKERKSSRIQEKSGGKIRD